MNRTPYRRVTPSRRGGGDTRHEYEDEKSETISRGETLIMQCIISGVLMVLVLIASMADIAPAHTVRNGISQVLSGAETLDELIADIRQFGADWLDLGIAPIETAAPEEFYIPSTGFPDMPPPLNPEQTNLPYTYYENPYTDHLPPAAEDQASNLTVPEPPVTPGLWD